LKSFFNLAGISLFCLPPSGCPQGSPANPLVKTFLIRIYLRPLINRGTLEISLLFTTFLFPPSKRPNNAFPLPRSPNYMCCPTTSLNTFFKPPFPLLTGRGSSPKRKPKSPLNPVLKPPNSHLIATTLRQFSFTLLWFIAYIQLFFHWSSHRSS